MFERVSKKEWLRALEDLKTNNPGLWNYVYAKDIKDEDYDIDTVELPRRSTPFSAGYDFYSPFEINAIPGLRYLVPTGIKCKLTNIRGANAVVLENLVLKIYPRSSYGMKYGFRFANTTCIIDLDFYGNETNEGHIYVDFSVENPIHISKGDKFCQGIIENFYVFKDEIEPLNKKRTGGMGSTGK